MKRKKSSQLTQVDSSLKNKLTEWMNRTHVTIDSSRGIEFIKIKTAGSRMYLDDVECSLREFGIEPQRFEIRTHVIQIKREDDIKKLVELTGYNKKPIIEFFKRREVLRCPKRK